MYKKLKQVLETSNIKLIAIIHSYLIQILSNKIDQIKNYQKESIYRIPVTLPNNERFMYVGETKLIFLEVLQERLRNMSQWKQNIALARFYYSNEGSTVDFDETMIIILCNNPYANKILESFTIPKHGQYV